MEFSLRRFILPVCVPLDILPNENPRLFPWGNQAGAWSLPLYLELSSNHNLSILLKILDQFIVLIVVVIVVVVVVVVVWVVLVSDSNIIINTAAIARSS